MRFDDDELVHKGFIVWKLYGGFRFGIDGDYEKE
jgi:hypothetical protein